jgi:hypothetical protein
VRNNLASFANVSAALGGVSDADAPRVRRMIGMASSLVYSVIQRPNLFRHTCSDMYDGRGSNRLMLRQWPVLSVESLTVEGIAIPPAAGYGQAGYRLEQWDGSPPGSPQSLILSGSGFHRGIGNVAVAYTAGYCVLGESQTIPAASPFTITADAPSGTWAVDHGVAYSDGATLSKVAANPAQGQYAVTDGIYTFNTADAGRAVRLTYSYIPADIEQAVIDIVVSSNEFDAGGNVKVMKAGDATLERFSPSAISRDTMAMLQPFKSVVGI